MTKSELGEAFSFLPSRALCCLNILKLSHRLNVLHSLMIGVKAFHLCFSNREPNTPQLWHDLYMWLHVVRSNLLGRGCKSENSFFSFSATATHAHKGSKTFYLEGNSSTVDSSYCVLSCVTCHTHMLVVSLTTGGRNWSCYRTGSSRLWSKDLARSEQNNINNRNGWCQCQKLTLDESFWLNKQMIK